MNQNYPKNRFNRNPAEKKFGAACRVNASHIGPNGTLRYIRDGKPIGNCVQCTADTHEKRKGTEKYISSRRKWIKHYHLRHKEKLNAQYREIKREVIGVYGGSCQCPGGCNESLLEFMSIDHINDDGAEHRKNFKGNIYRWLRYNNYPNGFRVLCMNCNTARGFYGYCPHEQKNG